MATTNTLSADYQRAVKTVPALRAVEAITDALCALRRPTDRLCYGCAWEHIIKPLVTPHPGWERGYPPHQPEDPDPNRPPGRHLRVRRASDLPPMKAPAPATTDTERWLRTSEAFDAFTDVILARLEAADPGNGHGIGRKEHP